MTATTKRANSPALSKAKPSADTVADKDWEEAEREKKWAASLAFMGAY